MELGMFRTKEQYVEWLEGQVRHACRKLNLAIERYEKIVAGEGKTEWLSWNRIDDEELAEEAWKNHTDWARVYVKREQKNLDKLKRILEEVQNG